MAPNARAALVARILLIGGGLFILLPFSTDVYLTAMVDLGREFGVAMAGVQRTMLSFTLGFGLAHLFIGDVADRYGRRNTALVGVGLYVFASVLAGVSPSLNLLILARFLQGLAAASGPILSRTIVRDVVKPEATGAAFAKLGALGAIGPITAPLIGALAATYGGWRAAMAVLVTYGCGLALWLWLRLPETRPTHLHGAEKIPKAKALKHLLAHRQFVIGAAALGCGYGVLLTWISTSAFLLIGILGLSKFEASAVYVIGSASNLGGALLSLALARRYAPRAILQAGACLVVVGSLAPGLLLASGSRDGALVLIAVMPFYFGWGLGQPMAIATAMRPFPEMAGQASAWLGLAQTAGGIALSLTAGLFTPGFATPWIMLVGALGLAATSLVPEKARRA